PVALPGHRVGDPDAQRARIADLAVGAGQVQVETDVGAPGERLNGTDPPVEALLLSVQVVLSVVDLQLVRLAVQCDADPVYAVAAVVDGQLVGPAVQGEAAPVDAVAVAADQGAEVGAGGDVGLQAAEAERDVRVPAAPVRDLQGLHDAAVGQHPHPGPAVLQRPAVDLRAVREPPEGRPHRPAPAPAAGPAGRGVRGAPGRGGGGQAGRRGA